MFSIRMRWSALALVVVAHVVLGAVWYVVLEQPWLAAVGKTVEEIPQGSPALYALPVAAALLNAWLVAWLLARSGQRGAANGMAIGLAIAMATVVPFSLVHNAFAGFPISLSLIDAGLAVVSLAMTGLILGRSGVTTGQLTPQPRPDRMAQPAS